jgi:hypothetical protein
MVTLRHGSVFFFRFGEHCGHVVRRLPGAYDRRWMPAFFSCSIRLI